MNHLSKSDLIIGPTGYFYRCFRLILVNLAWLSFCLSMSAQSAWDFEYTLPVNAVNYPRAYGSKYSINTAYEVAVLVARGQTLRLKVLIPPGASKAKISAQSNSWQCAPDMIDSSGRLVPRSERCPIMDGFDDDPGDFCANNPTPQNQTPCGSGNKVYPQDLHTVTARLLDILYPTEPNSPDELTQARYAYFTLYQQPQALGYFAFTSNLGISFGISNVALYNQWIDNGRGGTNVPSTKTYTLTIAPTPQNGTIGSSDSSIVCGSGGTNCQNNYTQGQQVNLYTSPAAGFDFVSWEGHCSGTDVWTYQTMNANKTCTAIFSQQQSFPEIEVFYGATALINESSTPIDFGSTPVGLPITKTFTLKNSGNSALTLTDIVLPTGFSLPSGLPGAIQPNETANFTIKLEASAEGNYHNTVNIINNDPDETQFNFLISGNVTSKRDINLGNLGGNLILGNADLFPGNAQIIVMISMENYNGFLEPITLEDNQLVGTDQLVNINATIIPEPEHRIADIVVVAAWEYQNGISWYQKTPSENMLYDTGWEKLSNEELSQIRITPLGIRIGENSYAVNVVTGKLIPPDDGFGEAKKVNFYIGYGFWGDQASGEKGFSYVLSWPITLQFVCDCQRANK